MKSYYDAEKSIRFIVFHRENSSEIFKTQVHQQMLAGDCIYFLIKRPSDDQKIQVYVGETSDIRTRISDHCKKYFWEYCIVFSCSNFNKWGGESARKHVEAYLINHLLKLNKCVLMNYQLENESRNIAKYGNETTKIWIDTFFAGAFSFMFYELKLHFLFSNEQIEALSLGTDETSIECELQPIVRMARESQLEKRLAIAQEEKRRAQEEERISKNFGTAFVVVLLAIFLFIVFWYLNQAIGVDINRPPTEHGFFATLAFFFGFCISLVYHIIKTIMGICILYFIFRFVVWNSNRPLRNYNSYLN